MVTYEWTESAAASAVGSVLNNGQRGQNGPRSRRVNRIRVGGSAAAGDAKVDLFYGDTYIGRFTNTIAGAVAAIAWDQLRDNQFPDPKWITSPGEFINVIIADAGATNVIVVQVDVEEF